jgi:HPP family
MQPAAKPYNVIVGHLIALSTAFVVTALTGAADEPFVTHELVFIRVVCSAVALGLAVAMELLLQASHPRRRLQCFSLRLAVFHPLFKVRSASWLE